MTEVEVEFMDHTGMTLYMARLSMLPKAAERLDPVQLELGDHLGPDSTCR